MRLVPRSPERSPAFLCEHAPQEGVEHVGVLPFVVFPACFRDEERHVRLAVVVVTAVPGPFNERPEAFDGVGVDITHGVCLRMVDNFMGHQAVNGVVAPVLVCDQERGRQGDMLLQELDDPFSAQVCSDLGHHAPAPLNDPNDRRFLRATSRRVRGVVVLRVGASGLAAHIGFVGFDDSLEDRVLVGHRGPDTMLHVERGRMRGLDVPCELVAGQALLGVQHQIDCQEPLPQVYLRFLEDRPGEHVVATVAGMAVPAPDTALLGLAGYMVTMAMWAGRSLRPTDVFQVNNAGCLRWEFLENFN